LALTEMLGVRFGDGGVGIVKQTIKRLTDRIVCRERIDQYERDRDL